MPHHVPHARGKGEGDLLERHSRGNAQAERRDREAQRCVELEPGDEEQKQENGSSYAGQQVPVVGCDGGWIHRQIIPYGRDDLHSVNDLGASWGC